MIQRNILRPKLNSNNTNKSKYNTNILFPMKKNNNNNNNYTKSSTKKSFHNRLRLFCTRTWKTNTIFILLVCNLYHIMIRYDNDNSNTISKIQKLQQQLRGGNNESKKEEEETQSFNENNILLKTPTDHLIIVAGHSVTISNHLQDARSDESDWYLLPYQKGQGLPQVIHLHIQAGIREAAKDVNSLLVFTGGETRSSAGPVNEGASYFHVADTLHMWRDFSDEEKDVFPGTNSVRARTITEEFATDSFQNLEITSNYPKKITIISFSFKRHRFVELHRLAIQYPQTKFQFIGIDPPPKITQFNLEIATKGEVENSVKPFEKDPYGCHSDALKKKRMDRNPFKRTPPYELTCPEIEGLLKWCGPGFFKKDGLPWSNLE